MLFKFKERKTLHCQSKWYELIIHNAISNKKRDCSKPHNKELEFLIWKHKQT